MKTADTVGFWWYCEALAELKCKEATPVLVKYATAKANPPKLYGPEGMALGYPAARALARIVADVRHPAVARLLKEENLWLRAGALRGLAEASADGVVALFRDAADETQPAIVRQEARVQRQRLGQP